MPIYTVIAYSALIVAVLSLLLAIIGYKEKKANLRATLKKNEEYIFTLAPSGSGHPNYYGLIEPFIFQMKKNKIEVSQ